MGFGHVVQKHRPIYKVQKFSQKTKKYHLKHWKNECFPFGTCSCWWKKSYTTWGIKPCQQWDKLPYQLVQDFVHQQYVRIWRFCTHLFFFVFWPPRASLGGCGTVCKGLRHAPSVPHLRWRCVCHLNCHLSAKESARTNKKRGWMT